MLEWSVIAGAGLGVPVADIVSAPSAPSTFADAALHGGFSPIGALTSLRVLNFMSSEKSKLNKKRFPKSRKP